MQEMEVIETSDALLRDDATEQTLMSQERDVRHNSMAALRGNSNFYKESKDIRSYFMRERKETRYCVIQRSAQV